MLQKGVKDSTGTTYSGNWREYVNTMTRLNFSLDEILVWPTPDIFLVIYIIDCALVRPKPNVWNTIRNKLAAIDYYNSLALHKTSWSDNPALANLVAYCKKKNASDPNNTALPFMRVHLIKYVDTIIGNMIDAYDTFRIPRDVNAKINKLIILRELKYHQNFIPLRMVVIATTIMALTGMRVGEVLHKNDLKDHSYGIRLSDLEFLHKVNINNKYVLIVDNKIRNDKTFHAVRITIRNSKMRNSGQKAYAMIGRSNFRIDPALMIYDLFHCLKSILAVHHPSHWTAKKHSFLIQNGCGKPLSINNYRKMHTILCTDCCFFNIDRISRPHALRKGFASWCTRIGLPPGFIAYVGRWILPHAYYIYVTYYQQDMIKIADYYFNKSAVNAATDLDDKESLYLIRQGDIINSDNGKNRNQLLKQLFDLTIS